MRSGINRKKDRKKKKEKEERTACQRHGDMKLRNKPEVVNTWYTLEVPRNEALN